MYIYKAAVSNIVDGKNIGGENSKGTLISEDFNNLVSAIKGAEDFRVKSGLSIVEVRRYDFINNDIRIAFDDPKVDSGIVVYRDVKQVMQAVRNEYEKSLKEDNDWEGTMSYMLDCIKDNSTDEWNYLHDAVSLLSDEEINELMDETGDREYMVCVNGRIKDVSVDALQELKEKYRSISKKIFDSKTINMVGGEAAKELEDIHDKILNMMSDLNDEIEVLEEREEERE